MEIKELLEAQFQLLILFKTALFKSLKSKILYHKMQEEAFIFLTRISKMLLL